MRRLPIVVLTLSVFLAACGGGGTQTQTQTPTPTATPITEPSMSPRLLSAEDAERLAVENSDNFFRQMTTVETATVPMTAQEAAARLEDLGLGTIPLIADDLKCPPETFGCGFGARQSEPGYLVISRGPSADRTPGPEPIPEIVVWTWVAVAGGMAGPSGQLVEAD